MVCVGVRTRALESGVAQFVLLACQCWSRGCKHSPPHAADRGPQESGPSVQRAPEYMGDCPGDWNAGLGGQAHSNGLWYAPVTVRGGRIQKQRSEETFCAMGTEGVKGTEGTTGSIGTLQRFKYRRSVLRLRCATLHTACSDGSVAGNVEDCCVSFSRNWDRTSKGSAITCTKTTKSTEEQTERTWSSSPPPEFHPQALRKVEFGASKGEGPSPLTLSLRGRVHY